MFNFSRPGVTITSYPGERATVAGYPAITAPGVTVSYLNFNLDNVRGESKACAPAGQLRPETLGLEIDANDVTFEHNNVSQSGVPFRERGGGIGVGFNSADSNVVIRYNRIHDLGWCPVESHAIYIDHVSGAQVYGNWIYNIPGGTGVQLWSTTADSHIYANVIDRAASGFTLGCCSQSADDPTHGNLIDHNVVTNEQGVPYARLDPLPPTGPDPGVPIWTFWSARPGAGNVYQHNLAYCARRRQHCTTRPGSKTALSYSDNIVANPRYVSAAAHDYRVWPGSPVASWGLWNGDRGGVPGR